MSKERLKALISQLDMSRLPTHVAIIMDGNGRWAKLRGEHRSVGHYRGVDSVREVTRIASDLGVKYLTLYAFSTENWGRPQDEVDTLMYLIGHAIEQETPELMANNVRLELVGDIGGLPADSRDKLLRSRQTLRENTGLTLMLCLNYSSRWELTNALRNIAVQVSEKSLSPEMIDDRYISSQLATYPAPDPDMLIRTGGEKRISNFLLWQISYSELLFTDTLWPDFRKESFVEALLDFQKRERRYGKTSEQVSNPNIEPTTII